jgi:hypothetical protein
MIFFSQKYFTISFFTIFGLEIERLAMQNNTCRLKVEQNE